MVTKSKKRNSKNKYIRKRYPRKSMRKYSRKKNRGKSYLRTKKRRNLRGGSLNLSEGPVARQYALMESAIAAQRFATATSPATVAVATVEPVTPMGLPQVRLSIEIHAFALFVHYQLRLAAAAGDAGNPVDFTFFVTPRPQMEKIFENHYGKKLIKGNYEKSEKENLKKIKAPFSISGVKIFFKHIFEEYGRRVPEKFLYRTYGGSYIGGDCFQLLKKEEKIDKIHSFYNMVRKFFRNIVNNLSNYLDEFKNFLTENGINYDNYDLIENCSNFGAGRDAIYHGKNEESTHGDLLDEMHEILEEKINETDDESLLMQLVQYYVDVCGKQIGPGWQDTEAQFWSNPLNLHDSSVRPNGPEDAEYFKKWDTYGDFMIVKLKSESLNFEYDNTEMVVHTCKFQVGIPVQTHIGIMKNPSDYVKQKLKKKCPTKYDLIILENDKERIF
jgi:hypothetical protein